MCVGLEWFTVSEPVRILYSMLNSCRVVVSLVTTVGGDGHLCPYIQV